MPGRELVTTSTHVSLCDTNVRPQNLVETGPGYHVMRETVRHRSSPRQFLMHNLAGTECLRHVNQRSITAFIRVLSPAIRVHYFFM